MKKPWVIGLLSIIPSLGFFVLGYTWVGIITAIITVGAIILSFLTSTWENFSETVLVLGLVAWVSQLIIAVLLAQSEARSEALPRREVYIAPPAQDASLEEKRQRKIRKTVLELLGPGENLKTVLEGRIGTIPILKALIYGLIGSPPTVTFVYLGNTDEYLIKVILDNFSHKPSELQRIPINQILWAKSREGRLSDWIDIQVGETKPLSIEVARSSREATRQLIGYLTGTPYQNVTSSPEVHDPGAFTTLRQNLNAKHPILVSALLGTCGGIAGTVIAAVLSLMLGFFLANGSGSEEGLGYLIGLYCLFMFPVGGAILGGVPGVIVGMFQRSQGGDMTLLPPALAGFLTVVVLTLGAISAIFLFPYP